MGEQSIHYDDIGEVVFIKNKRAKNLRITINRQKGVRVTIPGNVSYKYAYTFVEQKKEWIRKSLDKFIHTGIPLTVFTPETEFATRYHYVSFTHIPNSELKVRVSKGLISVTYPTRELLLTESCQQLIRKAIVFALRKEAKHYFPLRVEILAKKFALSYKDVRVKNLKSRWGSCSVDNNINLNVHLMRLPEYLSDYVILHELAHTVHKNHGKLFWKMLDQLSGDARKLSKEMKLYQTQIY